MADQARTGKVKAKTITARNVITGFKASGDVSEATLESALKLIQNLDTGDVIVEDKLEASGDVVLGVLIDRMGDREFFQAQLEDLKQQLGQLKQLESNRELQAASDSLDAVLAEAEKPEPFGKLVKKRLGEVLEFITDAGQVLEVADKAAPLVAKAVITATALYQAAQTLF